MLVGYRRDGLELGFANAELEQAQRQLAEASDQDRAELLSQLGKAWYARFGVTGEPADLNHAVDLARQAAEAAPGDYRVLADLASAEEVRFRAFGELGTSTRWPAISGQRCAPGVTRQRGTSMNSRYVWRCGSRCRQGCLSGSVRWTTKPPPS